MGKALGKDKAKDTYAYQALKQIGAIYKIEEDLVALTPEERVKRRQLSVKPLVEAFFAWIRENRDKIPPKSETGKGFTYCLNQEQYLKVFLENGMVPADNNAALYTGYFYPHLSQGTALIQEKSKKRCG